MKKPPRTVKESYYRAKRAQQAPPPPAPVAPPVPSQLALAIDQVLASLGGGPDRAAYTAPFDAAAQRANAAFQAAVPQIGAGYERLRGELGTAQAGADQTATQAQAAMAAQQAALRGQMGQLTAPVLADLARNGGPAIGGLTGAMAAQVGTQQAQLAQQGAAQTQLSQNLQQAGQASYNSRVADSRLAEQAAKANSSNTLAQVIARLDQQRAAALQAYSQDAQRGQAQRASLIMQKAELADRASERQAELAERRSIEQERRNDPRRRLDDLQAMDALSGYERARNLPPVNVRFSEWSKTSPVATSVLQEIFKGSEDLDDAYEVLKAMEAKQKRKDGKVKFQGKRIDVNWLKARLNDLQDYWA